MFRTDWWPSLLKVQKCDYCNIWRPINVFFFLQKNLCCCFSQLPTCICLESSSYWSLCIICCSLSTCWQHNQVTKGNPQDYSWRNVRNRLGPFLVTSLKKKKIEKIRQGHYLKCIANLLLTLTLDQKQFVIKKNIAAPLVLLHDHCAQVVKLTT